MILTLFAIAAAVAGWSPVTMITLIPALLHTETELSTPFLGGSFNDTKPANVRFHIGNQPSIEVSNVLALLQFFQPYTSN